MVRATVRRYGGTAARRGWARGTGPMRDRRARATVARRTRAGKEPQGAERRAPAPCGTQGPWRRNRPGTGHRPLRDARPVAQNTGPLQDTGQYGTRDACRGAPSRCGTTGRERRAPSRWRETQPVRDTGPAAQDTGHYGTRDAWRGTQPVRDRRARGARREALRGRKRRCATRASSRTGPALRRGLSRKRKLSRKGRGLSRRARGAGPAESSGPAQTQNQPKKAGPTQNADSVERTQAQPRRPLKAASSAAGSV